MILQRLYELALRENLLDDQAFVRCPVSVCISLNADGKYLGVQDLRQRVETPAKGRRAANVKMVGGMVLPVPVRPVVWDVKAKRWKTTDPAASGTEKPAVFLADALPRVVPCDDLLAAKYKGDANAAKLANEIAKYASQRSTFSRFIKYAAGEMKDETLAPLVKFLEEDLLAPGTISDLAKQFSSHGFGLGDLCSFSILEDGGRVLLAADSRKPALDWWREFCRVERAAGELSAKVRGVCQVTRKVSTLESTVKTKIEGLIPIGCRAEAFLVTGLDSAESYGFKGSAARMVSAEGIEGFTRALNSLIAETRVNPDKSPCKSKLVIGGTAFLYWTKEPVNTGFMDLINDPSDDPMKQLVDSVHKGKNAADAFDAEPFYLLALSGNSARAVVRGYLETTLPAAKANVAEWFKDLRIADTSKDYSGSVNDKYALSWLTGSAIPSKQGKPDWKKLPDDVPRMLLDAAVFGKPISDSLLLACLRRLMAEGSAGFRPARMALIKLILIRKGVPVEPQLEPEKPQHAAYVYGRFLAVCEDIQRAALGKVNTNIVDRYYGRLSTAPSFILRRMIDGALDHLKRVRTTKEALHAHLDRRLAEVIRLMPADPLTGQMSFEDQARFSIGYYHEKAAGYARIAKRKREKAEAEEEQKRKKAAQ